MGNLLAKVAAISVREVGSSGGDAQRIMMNAAKKQREGKASQAFNVPDGRKAQSTTSKINAMPAKDRLRATVEARRRSQINPNKLPAIANNKPMPVSNVIDLTASRPAKANKLPALVKQPTMHNASSGKLGGLLSKLKGRTGLAIGGLAATGAAYGALHSRKDPDLQKAAEDSGMGATVAAGSALGLGLYGNSVRKRSKPMIGKTINHIAPVLGSPNATILSKGTVSGMQAAGHIVKKDTRSLLGKVSRSVLGKRLGL